MPVGKRLLRRRGRGIRHIAIRQVPEPQSFQALLLEAGPALQDFVATMRSRTASALACEIAQRDTMQHSDASSSWKKRGFRKTEWSTKVQLINMENQLVEPVQQ